MKNTALFGIGVILLCTSLSLAQGYTLTSEDIILLKQNNFSEETLQRLIAAPELKISVDELIKLKDADLAEDTILELAIKNKTPAETSIVQQTRAEKFRLYDSKKKSSTKAMGCSCLIPSLGHFYVDNWKRGLYFAGGRIAFLAILESGLETRKYTTPVHCTTNCSGGHCTQICTGGEEKTETITTNQTAVTIGQIGFAVLTIWEIYDVSKEVKKYNDKLYQEIMGEDTGMSFNWVPIKTMGGDYTLGMQLSYNF